MPARKRTRTKSTSKRTTRPKTTGTKKPAGKSRRTRSAPSITAHSLDHSMFDASAHPNMPLAVPGVVGSFVTIDSVVRDVVSSGNNDIWLIFQHTDSGVRCTRWNASTRALQAVYFDTQLEASNPTSVRRMRGTFKIRNTTTMTSINGTVRVLKVPQALEWFFDAIPNPSTTIGDLKLTLACAQSIQAMLNNFNGVRSFSASELMTTRKIDLLPASMSQFQEYHGHSALVFTTPTSNELSLLTQQLAVGAVKNPQETLIVQISSTGAGAVNLYDWSWHSQDACRYSANSTLASLARNAPAVFQQGHFENIIRSRASLPSTMILEPPPGNIGPMREARQRASPYTDYPMTSRG